METKFLEISNGKAIRREQIPHLSFDDFHQDALNIVGNGGKAVHYFAYSDGGSVKLLALLRTETLLVAGCDAPEAYPSLTIQCEPFHMFEREIAEQFGIRPEGLDSLLPVGLFIPGCPPHPLTNLHALLTYFK